MITKEQFIEELNKKGKSIEWMEEQGLDIFPCSCGEENCRGWRIDGEENNY